MLHDMGIWPIINARKTQLPKKPPLGVEQYVIRRSLVKYKEPRRWIYVREQHKNKKKWKEKYSYGLRWLVEIVISALKRNFGHYVMSKDKKAIENEMILKASLYNGVLNL